MTSILHELINNSYNIPNQEDLVKIAGDKWLDIFDEWEWLLSYAYKISLILDLDINNLSQVREYLLSDWEWNISNLDQTQISTKKYVKLFIDPNLDESIFENLTDLKIKLTENSAYTWTSVIVNWNEIDVTNVNMI